MELGPNPEGKSFSTLFIQCHHIDFVVVETTLINQILPSKVTVKPSILTLTFRGMKTYLALDHNLFPGNPKGCMFLLLP